MINKDKLSLTLFIVLLISFGCTPIVKTKKEIRPGIGYGARNVNSSNKKINIDTLIQKVLKGSPQTIGNRSKVSIVNVVLKNLAPLRHCYISRLREIPDLYGKLIIKFSIDSAGNVFTSEVVFSSMMDSSFDNRIKEKIRTWKFDPAPNNEPTEISYPFVFTSREYEINKLEYRALQAYKTGPRETKRLYDDINSLTNLLNLECCASKVDTLKGEAKFKLTINSNGKVERLELLTQSINNSTFVNDIIKIINLFKFGKEKGTEQTSFVWTFQFNKEHLICKKK